MGNLKQRLFEEYKNILEKYKEKYPKECEKLKLEEKLKKIFEIPEQDANPIQFLLSNEVMSHLSKYKGREELGHIIKTYIDVAYYIKYLGEKHKKSKSDNEFERYVDNAKPCLLQPEIDLTDERNRIFDSVIYNKLCDLIIDPSIQKVRELFELGRNYFEKIKKLVNTEECKNYIDNYYKNILQKFPPGPIDKDRIFSIISSALFDPSLIPVFLKKEPEKYENIEDILKDWESNVKGKKVLEIGAGCFPRLIFKYCGADYYIVEFYSKSKFAGTSLPIEEVYEKIGAKATFWVNKKEEIESALKNEGKIEEFLKKEGPFDILFESKVWYDGDCGSYPEENWLVEFYFKYLREGGVYIGTCHFNPGRAGCDSIESVMLRERYVSDIVLIKNIVTYQVAGGRVPYINTYEGVYDDRIIPGEIGMRIKTRKIK